MNSILFRCFFFFSFVYLTGCQGCSKSGNRETILRNEHDGLHNEKGTDSRNVIKMQERNGVYEIPTEINGVPMEFIFDTGAGLISISSTEVNFLLKQGLLSKSDIVGSANFIDANGDVSEGTIIMLKTVKIGNRTLNNIEASVVHNLNAPLLMGQSALAKFGKISINYDKLEIAFE